eukprot:TRINITY_DN105145_c0_g1_i1.p1 TRINITY_DN105145_c0_g1~~TRINITY_DN105145_c0_g1_i1.p1  ORF type:complete len:142 (-),score=27.31 TRINITY_DN105145_c0_g1_i1:396-821(-)
MKVYVLIPLVCWASAAAQEAADGSAEGVSATAKPDSDTAPEVKSSLRQQTRREKNASLLHAVTGNSTSSRRELDGEGPGGERQEVVESSYASGGSCFGENQTCARMNGTRLGPCCGDLECRDVGCGVPSCHTFYECTRKGG